MQLGYFSFPVHPKNKSLSRCFEEDKNAILLIDKLGFKEAFLGEHLTDEHERISSSLLFISSLIHKTKNINLGTGTLNLPHHNPATCFRHCNDRSHFRWKIDSWYWAR